MALKQLSQIVHRQAGWWVMATSSSCWRCSIWAWACWSCSWTSRHRWWLAAMRI